MATHGPKDRPARSAAELEAAAGHVAYEIEMMLFAAEHIGTGHASPATPPRGKVYDVYLESFLLHFRNLRAFLCPGQPVRDDDILARDFFGAARPADVANGAVLGKRKEQIDRALAHLSYSRLEYDAHGEKYWDVESMCDAISVAFAAFLGRLPVERRAWFLNEKR